MPDDWHGARLPLEACEVVHQAVHLQSMHCQAVTASLHHCVTGKPLCSSSKLAARPASWPRDQEYQTLRHRRQKEACHALIKA